MFPRRFSPNTNRSCCSTCLTGLAPVNLGFKKKKTGHSLAFQLPWRWMQAPKPFRRDPAELEKENQQLHQQLDQAQRRIERLEQDKQDLRQNIEHLKKEL